MADEKSEEKATPAEEEQGSAIKVGETAFETQEELVESYQKLLTEKQNLEKLYGRQSNELGGLRKQASTGAKPKPEYSGYGEQLIDEPGVVLEKVAGSLKAEILEELTLQEAAKKNEDAYWDKFFSANESLAAHREKIVFDAYNRLWPELEGKSFEDQAKRIATEWSFVGENSLSDEPSGSEAPSGSPKSAAPAEEKAASGKQEAKKFGDLIQSRFDDLYKE